MIISGFAEIEKTYLGNKHKDVKDLEASDYKCFYSDELKNMDREKRSIEILAELRLRKIPFLVVIPDISLKVECVERCKKRGNDEVFIGFISDYYEYFINILMNRNDPKIILKSGEYLERIL
ncbi:hypothetical protein [Hungatella hathewayi]|uniref:hypothetical protein n=1 Tax=Hungatella hathewayi TaxID=154046 RepID=UPI0035660FD6